MADPGCLGISFDVFPCLISRRDSHQVHVPLMGMSNMVISVPGIPYFIWGTLAERMFLFLLWFPKEREKKFPVWLGMDLVPTYL